MNASMLLGYAKADKRYLSAKHVRDMHVRFELPAQSVDATFVPRGKLLVLGHQRDAERQARHVKRLNSGMTMWCAYEGRIPETPVCTENLNPNVMVMDRARQELRVTGWFRPAEPGDGQAHLYPTTSVF